MKKLSLTDRELEHLETIYDAYDRIHSIASHRWKPGRFYDPDDKTSDLFGHYVRSLDQFKERSPDTITWEQYDQYSTPLIEALDSHMNTFGDYYFPSPRDEFFIGAYCDISAPHFFYDRCMLLFRAIEKHFPRASYRHHSSQHRSRRAKHNRTQAMRNARATTTDYSKKQYTRTPWLPYKD